MTRQTGFILVFLLYVFFVSSAVIAQHSYYATSILNHDTTPVNEKFRQLIKQRKQNELRAYLNQGADPNSQDTKGVRPIHYAAFLGNTEALRLLIQQGASLSDVPFGGWTPLHYAALSGHLDIISLLTDMGANVNAKDSGGETPLFYAIETSENTLLMVSLLVEQGADINVLNTKQESPVFIARSLGVTEVVEYLLNKGAIDSTNAQPNSAHSHDGQ